MRLNLLAKTFGAASLLALLATGPAMAQRSLFDQPVQAPPALTTPPPSAPPAAAPAPAPAPQAAAPADAESAEAPARPKARPKKRGPSPARSLAIFNGSPQPLTALEVSQEGRTGALKKPLAPGKRTRLALPAFKGCEVTVAATFEGGQPETSAVDICKEKSLNFRN